MLFSVFHVVPDNGLWHYVCFSIMASATPQRRLLHSRGWYPPSLLFWHPLTKPQSHSTNTHAHTAPPPMTCHVQPCGLALRTAALVNLVSVAHSKAQFTGKERAPSESQGSTHEGAQSSTPSLARHSEPRTPASPVTPDLSRGLGDTQQKQTEADKGPEGNQK